MINTDNKYVLMIEPIGGPESPVNDKLTSLAESAFKLAKASDHRYRGWHTCVCGARSDNRDWILPSGRITNSLLVHYVRDHRSEVPLLEFCKLQDELNVANGISYLEIRG